MSARRIEEKMGRLATIGAVAVCCLALALGGTTVLADSAGRPLRAMAEDDEGDDSPGQGYLVTITNLTYDQIISPPVVIVHDGQFSLFQPGQPAGDELAALAEDGMTGPLVGLLGVSMGVFDYAVAAGGIPPAGSITVEVRAKGKAKLLSMAGMLVSTNDAFAGLDGHEFMSKGASFDAEGYDAGSEANTESCDHIPGPPCGNPGVRVTDGAEGFVHIHRGIQGDADLDGSAKDWRNPVAHVEIERM